MLKRKNILFGMLSIAVCSSLYASDTKNLGDITVTANKMEESISKIPQSISIIDENKIENSGITNIKEFATHIPSFNAHSFNYFTLSNFRGLNTSAFTNTSPLVIYVDGIPTSNRQGYDLNFANIKRVEVLRGPQGTLYGKDAIGGVINVISKTSNNKWEGKIGLEYGNNNTQYAKFYSGGALKEDEVFFNLYGSYEHNDGWIENTQSGMKKDANGLNKNHYGFDIIYLPTEDLKVKASISNSYEKQDGLYDTVYLPSSINIKKVKRSDYESLSYNNETFTKNKTSTQALSFNYFLGDLILDSITTHKTLDSDGNYEMDAGNGIAFIKDSNIFLDATSETTTQEFRLSNDESDYRWITGLYFERDKLENDRFGSYLSAFNSTLNAKSKTTSDTKAIFGQIVVPFSENYELTLGGRYQSLTRDYDLENTATVVLPGFPGNFSVKEKETWNVFIPKAALSYEVNNNLTTYATFTKGYVAGGFNTAPSSSNLDNIKFDPQSSMNYEIGSKFYTDNLYLNSSIFFMDIKDVHVYSQNPTTGLTSTKNIDKAESYGLEIEGKYVINNSWNVNGFISMINAKYKSSYITSPNRITSQNKGNKIELTPKYSAKLGLEYISTKGVYGNFNLLYKGDTYLNPENTVKQDDYVTTDLKLGYKLESFNIYSYVNNISDKDYLVNYDIAPGGGQAVSFGRGRTFGLGLKYSF